MPRIIAEGIDFLTNNGGGNSNMKELTQKEYDNLSDEEKKNGTVYYITDSVSTPNKASNIEYDNSNSGLISTNVQAVINEIDEKVNTQSKADGVTYNNSTSELSSTNVQNAITEINNKVSEIKTAWSTEWWSQSSNPNNLATGIHGMGVLQNNVLKLRGRFINDAFSKGGEYSSIFGGIYLPKINELFGTNYTGCDSNASSFNIINTILCDAAGIDNVISQCTIIGNTQTYLFPARVYMDNGTSGGWPLNALPGGYYEFEIYLK